MLNMFDAGLPSPQSCLQVLSPSMWRACWLAPLAVLLWRLAPLAAAAAKYTDPDGWGPAEECVNWNEDDGIMGGFQPVDDFQEYVNPDVLYPATLAKLGMSLPVWKKCCMPSFNLLQACYQASVCGGLPGVDNGHMTLRDLAAW